MCDMWHWRAAFFLHVRNINYITNIITIITHQLLVYAVDVNILRGSIHTTKKNVEALVVASKEIGLEFNITRTVHRSITSSNNLVLEFIIPQYINSSTCFERYVAHHQEPQLYLQLLVYIRLWRPPVVPSDSDSDGTTGSLHKRM